MGISSEELQSGFEGVHLTPEQKEHIFGEKGGFASSKRGALLRQIILGGQDGLVNVLGIVLGVASATSESRIVIIAGIAATFAESLSMGAVAYTSSRAEQDHYRSELEREKREIEAVPDIERKEVELIYYKKGFRGKALEDVVKHITSDKQVWLDIMMTEELNLGDGETIDPQREAFVVGVSSFAGSFLPLIPFFLMPVVPAMVGSALLSLVILFAAGAVKAKLTIGDWRKSGLEMLLVGGIAGIAGYVVGKLLGVSGI